MTFDKILHTHTLWAVRYDGVADNAYAKRVKQDGDGSQLPNQQSGY